MKRILVVGDGVVGRTVRRKFPWADIKDIKNDVSTFDRNKTYDFVFVCVPTELRSGTLDCSIVFDSVRDVLYKDVVVKSTLSFSSLQEVQRRGWVYSPEFTGDTPWSTGTRVVIAAGPDRSIVAFKQLCDSVGEGNEGFKRVSMYEAFLIKMNENSFLALKVLFFHQLKLVSDCLGCNFEVIRECLAGDPRIGDSHTRFLGSYGYDSHCLNKDIPSYLNDLKIIGVGWESIMSSVLHQNESLKVMNLKHTPSQIERRKALEVFLESSGIKQQELAKLLSCSPVSISRILHGTRGFSDKMWNLFLKVK